MVSDTCLPFTHRINWLLVSKPFPIFPVVIFRHYSLAKGQNASLLSFCPRLVLSDHHLKDGKLFGNKKPTDSVTKRKEMSLPFFQW